MGIKVDKLAGAIQNELRLYSDDVNKAVKSAVAKVSKETVDELQEKSPKRTGAYRKDWTSQTAYESQRTKRDSVYNRKHYQVTHLLEKGHALRGGGRVRAYEHIKPAEEKAISKMEKLITQEVQG